MSYAYNQLRLNRLIQRVEQALADLEDLYDRIPAGEAYFIRQEVLEKRLERLKLAKPDF